MVAWVAAFLVGYFVTDFGIPAINSLIFAGIAYYGGMKAYALVTNQKLVKFAKTEQVL